MAIKEGTVKMRPNYWPDLVIYSDDVFGDGTNVVWGQRKLDGKYYWWSVEVGDCPIGSIPIGMHDLFLEQFEKARVRSTK